MSFYPQPNRYQCGPFALKYALVMLGIFKNENRIGIIAGSTWWAGTDEIGLSRAASAFDCKMKYFTSEDPDEAKKMLNAELKKGLPCILSVNNWEHWVTVVNYSQGKYVVVDSEMDKVVTVYNAAQLKKKWKYYDEDEDFYSYDGYAVKPKFKVTTRAKIKLSHARQLMFKKNEDLAKKWDHYFNDLISITRPRTKITTNFLTFDEFLRRHEHNLVKIVADWHGMPSYSEIEKIIDNMKFIAEVYDLIIPLAEEKRALIDITSLLMMYACGKYGMDPIY